MDDGTAMAWDDDDTGPDWFPIRLCVAGLALLALIVTGLHQGWWML